MISVIIPCYNEAERLPSLLEALRAGQSRLQIIVVDGGSSDNTAALAEDLADAVVVSARGRAVQMNAGAAMAEGDVLWFVHGDTEFCAPIDQYLSEIDAASSWGFCRLRLSGRQWYFRMIAAMINLRSGVQAIGTGDQALFVRRKLFDEIGGYAQIPLMEDVALCKTLKKVAKPLKLQLGLITSSRRWEQQGVIKTVLLMWQLRLLYFIGVSPETLVKRYYS